MRRPSKILVKYLKLSTPPFAKPVARRNYCSPDSNSLTLTARVILAGFVLAVRPGKEPVRQRAKEKFKAIKKFTPYHLVPSLLQETGVIFHGKSQTLHENEYNFDLKAASSVLQSIFAEKVFIM